VLTDPQTDQVVHTEALPYRFAIEHSPDCRFLIGHSMGYYDCSPGLIIWNATSGERMQAFNGFCDTSFTTFPRVIWKSDGSVAILSEWYRSANSTGSHGQRYLWYPENNSIIQLENETDWQTPRMSLFQVEWDDVRGWVWSSGMGSVVAFNTQTGARTAAFWNAPNTRSYYNYYTATASFFTFSPDRTLVVAHGQQSSDGWTEAAITVYDIATGASIEVNPELNAAGMIAVSPDNRYLTMSYTAVRVWDLQQLAEDVEDRLPIYRLPLPADFQGRVYFADATRLIVESASGEINSIYDMNTG
jgi:hypothetical protein